MIGNEYSGVDRGFNVAQETKIEVSIAHTNMVTLDMVNDVHILYNGCSGAYLFKNSVNSNINISGFNMHNDFK